TICGSTPLLQFYNISFRISRIHDSKNTDASYFCGNNVSDCAAASRNHCLERLVYIVHRKCDVTEPALVRRRQFGLDQSIIAENLKRRTIITIAGQSQMNAAKTRVLKRSQLIQPGARHIAFRAPGLASEDLGIESNQSFPISGNQICVNVFGADWHYCLLC